MCSRLRCAYLEVAKSNRDVGFGDMIMTAQKAPDLASEQRADQRVKLRLEGKLFLPAEETTFDCIIVDLG